MRHHTFRLRRSTAAALGLTGALLVTAPTVAAATPLAPFGSGSAAFGSTAPEVAEAPRLASVDNFRDIAGTGDGYAGFAGLHVNRGVFYRSNALTPNPEDLATLESLRLTAVYDLRSDGEIAAKADILPAGTAYRNIPVLDENPGTDYSFLDTPEKSLAYLQDAYRSMVNDPTPRAGFGRLLTALADTPGPQLFHCTAGKDRTGWTTALLLGIAGVPRETVTADYLLSNEYSAASIAASLAYISATKGPDAAAAVEPLITVDRSYLDAAFAEVDRNYGSLERYLTDGLGLSPNTVTKLRLKLLG